LTSIAWREAWKYRDRAYRYCLHDMGHAWQAPALGARALGCESFATGHFPDDEVALVCRLSGDEWPMLVISLSGECIPVSAPSGAEKIWFGGTANRLSSEQVPYPLIDRIQAATKLKDTECGVISEAEPAGTGSGEIKLPSPAISVRSFSEVVRARRSALDFEGGTRSMSLAQLSAILAVTAQPFSADFAGSSFIQLYLYAHRVDGLAPGVYRHWPRNAELEQVRSGDQRVAAAGLSLGQDLAGNACVAFSMIADLERATRAHGDRGYRYVHFEAGAIGHRLYLATEALGLGSTGIGAFFDDDVHSYLDLPPARGQVVYHFAIGYPVSDTRLIA
jgi:SagB-type dehydrogenase family enzyme